MKRKIACALILSAVAWSLAWSKDKKLPSGDAMNEAVGVNASVLDADELKQIFGTDFDNMFSVIEVTLTPKGGKPLEVHLDDFLLRSEQTGEHSGPLSGSQIAGQGTLVVHQNDRDKGKKGAGWSMGGLGMGMGGGSSAPPPEVRAEIKNSETRDPLLDVLKRKILAEKPTSETVSGLLFFPLDKEKPKNLALIYTTAPGKLRIKFK
jgi:hypothetical protein